MHPHELDPILLPPKGVAVDWSDLGIVSCALELLGGTATFDSICETIVRFPGVVARREWEASALTTLQNHPDTFRRTGKDTWTYVRYTLDPLS